MVRRLFRITLREQNNKVGYLLLISLLTLLTFLTLFVFRTLDDNRLTSWQWVFASIDVVRIFFILIFGIILAYVLSKVNPPESFTVHGSRFTVLGLFLFLFSFVIVIPFWKEPEVIVDVSRYFTQAKHLEIYGVGYFFKEWGKDIGAWTDMPLVPFLYGLIFKFLGESRLYIQIFTTLLFSMTVVLTYQIGKTLWDEDVGFSAGALLFGIPYLFTQVPLMLVDVPTMFFLTLSIFAFIKALERGGVMMIMFSSAAIFLTFFSKYSAWLILSVLVVIFLVYLKIDFPPSPSPPPVKGGGTGEKPALLKEGITLVPLPLRGGLGEGKRTILHRGVLIISISVVLIGIVCLLKFDVISEQIKLLLSYQKPGLRRWEEGFISTFFFQIHPFITASALYSTYVAFKRKDIKYAIISYLIILIVLLQIKRIRYIITIFPMLTLMASYGLREIRDKEIRRFVVLCIIISSLIIAVFTYLPFVQKISTVNLKYAGEFLDTIDEKNIEVFTLPQKEHVVNPSVSVPILDLFTKKRINYHYDTSFSPPQKEIEKSPLRFTWEYKNPEYYAAENKGLKGEMAIVIISGDIGEILPEHIIQRIKGYRISKVFKTSEGLFGYQTMVRIYKTEAADRRNTGCAGKGLDFWSSL
ncbi:MAG: glycosyltransferase family 39 protein [Nitrospirae bacterium]|nr:glycosyltransferase family 39 protein [Nitrospirota bacterium]